jgi:flagellar hook-basal body complex protein FliE
MDVKLTPAILSSLQKALQSGAPGGASPVAGAGAAGGASFANALGDALKSVSQNQSDAGALQRQFQAGAEGVSLEETMVAMQKAQIGFQAALTVRNRLVSAYSDIMNMQV